MAASSSTESSQKKYKHEVFLSFSGEDTRKTFVDHLYAALQRQGIVTYKDDKKIEQGNKISDELMEAIEDSQVFIIVFSKKYASSSWCLDELVKIIECQSKTDQIAFPVFYDVEPSEVGAQSGLVGDAFEINKNKENAGKWREALTEAAEIAGLELKETANGHEAEFIKKVVGKISLKLYSKNSLINENLIGMDTRIKLVLKPLETTFTDVHMIGIKGIGGGGKTTLARAIFNKVSARFEGKSFVENVREVSKAPLCGLKSLQKQVLSDMIHDHDHIVSSVDEGKFKLQKLMRARMVLVVLDDVDNIDQLEALAGARNWFKRGSLIIITTRDEQVLLSHGVDEIHDVNLLEDDEAMSLFNRYAFESENPTKEYEELSKEVVHYAAGLPLTIRVLGASLSGKKEHEWKGLLKRLRKIPLTKIVEKLELSYISLDNHHKEIFLDVACFLKFSHKDDAVRILECCGFDDAIYGLKDLEQKSLITVSDDQYLGMHDQIQAMGWNIVRRVDFFDPRRHSRLWIREEIEHILANDLGTDATSAITVQDILIKLGSEVVTKGFGKLERLRLLRVLSEEEDDYSCWDEMTNQACQSLPHTLRYLRWEFYPHCSLPNTFLANNLVALEMSHCRILRLWEGGDRKVLHKLRFLDLKYSQLTTIDLELTPNLEKLNLEHCSHLERLQTPIGCLKRLVYLNLSGCVKVDSFMFIKQLISLEVLCLNLLTQREFPDIIPEHCNSRLLELEFKFNKIEQLPSSIANFQKLVSLDLHSCRSLKSLPESICGLRNLRNLELYGCILEELPENIGHIEFLQKLNLSFAHIKHLPKSICKMRHLETLNLSSCCYLENLPSDIGRLECLEDLTLKECEQVKDIPDSICWLERLKIFSLLDCVRVEKLPLGIGRLKSLKILNVENTRIRQLPPSIHLVQGLKIYETKPGPQSRGYASTSGNFKTPYSKKRKIGH